MTSTIPTLKCFKSVVRNYSGLTIGSYKYLKIDTTANIRTEGNIPESWVIISFQLQGWTNSPVFQLAKGSNGTDIYVMGEPQTINQFKVEYIFAPA